MKHGLTLAAYVGLDLGLVLLFVTIGWEFQWAALAIICLNLNALRLKKGTG